MAVSIKFIGNHKAFAAEVKKDLATLNCGVASGLGEFMAKSLGQVAENGFVHVPPGADKRYPEAPGLNVKSKDRIVRFPAGKKNARERTVVYPGRMVFASGKVVSRRGRLPADLAGMVQKGENSAGEGVVALFGNGKSVIRVIKDKVGFHAQFLPNPKNMLAWLGFEYGRGVAGSMTVIMADGSETNLKGKVGQRRIIAKGLSQAMRFWNKGAQGKLDQYMKRKSRNAK